MKVSKNKKSKKAILSDIKPTQNRNCFNVSLKNDSRDLESFLLDDLKRTEEKIKRKEALEINKQKERDSEIKKEASNFNNICFDRFFSEKEIPNKIISSKIKEGLFIKEKNKIELKRREQVQKEKEEAWLAKRVEEKQRLDLLERARLRALEIQENEKQKKERKESGIRLKRRKDRERKIALIKNSLLAQPVKKPNFINLFKPTLAFSSFGLAIFLVFFATRLVSYGFQVKDEVLVKGANVVSDLEKAKTNFQNKDFSQLVLDFKKIEQEVDYINRELEKMESGVPEIVKKIPFISKYGSAKNLLEAGNEITKAMVMVSQVAEDFSTLNDNSEYELSLSEFILNLESKTLLAEEHLILAGEKINEVDPADLPIDYQEEVVKIKSNFPKVLRFLTEFNQKQFILKDLLGHNGHRKYLFLFQNNHEMRATGGFIGSYGLLNIHNGEVQDFFIDGIFNPDGQLSARVVPPEPIQKISTNWSTHDANWYPDFPTSARKIAWFYEKTGGPTVDGIITLTPTVMKKLLKITGPIEMPDYEVVIDSENFMENIQFEVEIDYDKEENQPKKIIADLAPKILERVFSTDGMKNISQNLQVLSESLSEKHILIYSENSDVQKIISDLGWSGEVLETKKDYLMVVNSNINGYKTDGVIDQKIEHEIDIEEDGSVIDTVTVERFHNGGNSKFDWWNQVNANYMRVYVPSGSELLEATGHTRESIDPPVNYDKLGFQRDAFVDSIENSVKIDKETGTEIWEEAGKTVFGNWVYVSPQEKVELVYKYRLPFKLNIDRFSEKMDNYSILYQKQSGMETSTLKTEIKLSDNQNVFWKYPDDIESSFGEVSYESNLEKDRFLGVVIK
jgi:hypothetical protein